MLPDRFISDFVRGKVTHWTAEIEKLSEIADSQPHSAYGAITHGLASKWSYLSRTTPDIEQTTTLRTQLEPPCCLN